MKTNLVGTANASFIIIEQGERAVIGRRSQGFQDYVAWSYHLSDSGEASYYWGRYCDTLEQALEAFKNKEGAK